MRTGAALGTTDTVSVVIFQAFNRDTRYGYASALAMMLLIIIIILTVINNRVAEKECSMANTTTLPPLNHNP
ncbi:MAG: hypothetical protein M5U34_09600 [Chloroflexi bacterium]|nr:hypothetical protein [Chloroflexota bacterium]